MNKLLLFFVGHLTAYAIFVGLNIYPSPGWGGASDISVAFIISSFFLGLSVAYFFREGIASGWMIAAGFIDFLLMLPCIGAARLFCEMFRIKGFFGAFVIYGVFFLGATFLIFTCALLFMRKR